MKVPYFSSLMERWSGEGGSNSHTCQNNRVLRRGVQSARTEPAAGPFYSHSKVRDESEA